MYTKFSFSFFFFFFFLVGDIFSCVGCNSCYIGETKRHLTTRTKEHLGIDENSHIYQHLNKNENFKNSASTDCFTIIDSVSFSFRLKMNEALYITWCKLDLNKLVNHVSMALNFYLPALYFLPSFLHSFLIIIFEIFTPFN